MTHTTARPEVGGVVDRDFRMLIGDALVSARSGATFDTRDPSSGEVVAAVPLAQRQDVERAVEAAHGAQPAWEALGVRGRREHFDRLARLVEEHAEELALLDAVDSGNPLRAMRFDVGLVLAQLRDYPSVALGLSGKTLPASPGNLHYTTFKPYGVVARIVPFNHPVMFAGVGALAPLIAGNAVVLKPAEQTPLSALRLGELLHEAFPPGVFNIVTGAAEAGDALVTHPLVKRIAFTGSGTIGRKIQQRAAEVGVKHVSLELGGKNPMIVFPDADVAEAAEGAVFGMNFGTVQGQSCGSCSRIFVHRRIYDEFVDRVRQRLEGFRVGPAYDEATEMGPLVSAQHHERVMGYVQSGRDEGASLVTGGGRPAGAELERGYFLAPTAFAGVTMDMRIGREEIFGPVMSIFSWTDYADVVAQANGTELGLTASVWTNDIHLAHATAERLDAGYVWINDTARHFWGLPFGGFKGSGVGREEAVDEVTSFLETKSVHTILKPVERAAPRVLG